MTHETAPTQSLMDDALNELGNLADDLDGTYPGRGDGDGLRRAAKLIRRQQALLTQPAAPVAVPDELRSALLWLLLHHQGGSSPIGQPIRSMLGIGQHDQMTEAQIAEAKAYRVEAPTSPAQQSQRERELLEALEGCIEHMEWSTEPGKAACSAAHAAIAKANTAPPAPEQAARPCTCFSDLQAKHCPRKCIGWHEGEPKQANHKAALEDIAAVLRQSPEWGADQLDEIVAILGREGIPVSEDEA